MRKILLTSIFSLFFSLFSMAQTSLDEMKSVITPDGSTTEGISADDAERIAEEIQNRQKEGRTAVKKTSGVKKDFVPKGELVEEIVQPKDSLTREEKKKKKAEVEKIEDEMAVEKEEEVNVYGHSFFENGNLKIYKTAGHTKAPDNYILGVGDEVNVSIWGYSEHQSVYTIGASGAIEPKTVGRIYLSGMTFGQAKKVISSRFGRVYDLKNSEISIDLNYSKVIRVNIVGEVNGPGTYSVSSINSAFNVLAISGGLTKIASIRDISIKRNNSTIKVLDVYKFLLNPSPENDFFLQDNDYIVVNPIKNVVKVSGQVKRPGYYELKDQEGIKELIMYAGGLSKLAVRTDAKLQTYEGDKIVFKDVDLEPILKGKSNMELKDGDNVQFMAIPSVVRNIVKVKGAVNVPGEYQYKEGEKVLDLLGKAHGVRYDTYLGRAYIVRTHPDFTKEYITLNLKEITKDPKSPLNYTLQEFDELVVYDQKGFSDTLFVEIQGAVRTPTRVPFSEELSVQDLIFMSGGLKLEAANGRIEISRISNFTNTASDEPTKIVIETVTVTNDLELGKETPIVLQPGDIVFVRSTPDFEMQKNILITGEVNYPGTYSLINKTEKLSSLIERAGGLNQWAFKEGATLWRFDKNGDSTIVIMDLKSMYKNKRKEFDYILQEGDKLHIPATRNLVTIIGAVKYPKVDSTHSVFSPFVSRRSARFYVKEYGGGFSDEAKRKSTYVESAGGYVKRTKNFGLFKVYPRVTVGDKIVVVYKEKKDTQPKKPVDWNGIVSRSLSQLAGLSSVVMASFTALKLTGAI
jgi:polysaccharide export outer membrane protein